MLGRYAYRRSIKFLHSIPPVQSASQIRILPGPHCLCSSHTSVEDTASLSGLFRRSSNGMPLLFTQLFKKTVMAAVILSPRSENRASAFSFNSESILILMFVDAIVTISPYKDYIIKLCAHCQYALAFLSDMGCAGLLFYSSANSSSICRMASSKTSRASSTTFPVDRSTPAVFRRLMGSLVQPLERNFR